MPGAQLTYSRLARLRDVDAASFAGGNLFAKWDSGTGKFVGGAALTPAGDGSGLTNLTAANIAAGTAPISVTGAAATLSATLPIAKGGTGATTAQAAIDALLPSQGSSTGKFLTTNGSNASWSAVPFVTAAVNTSGSGSTPVANGTAGSLLVVDTGARVGQTSKLAFAQGDLSFTLTAPLIHGTGGVRVDTPQAQAVVGGGTLAIDASAGGDLVIALRAGTNALSFANSRQGQSWRVTLRQPAGSAGGTVTWSDGVRWPGGVAPTLSVGNAAEDVVVIERRPGGPGADFRGTLVGLDY